MTTKLLVVDSSVVVDAFDTSSAEHFASHSFLEAARRSGFKLAMPVHGFFELKCAMHRLVHVEKRKVAPPYNSFESAIPFQLVHLDQRFLENYSDVEVEYAKGSDTIFMVIAKKLGLPLVSSDRPMLKRALNSGIKALTVAEGLQYVAA